MSRHKILDSRSPPKGSGRNLLRAESSRSTKRRAANTRFQIDKDTTKSLRPRQTVMIFVFGEKKRGGEVWSFSTVFDSGLPFSSNDRHPFAGQVRLRYIHHDETIANSSAFIQISGSFSLI